MRDSDIFEPEQEEQDGRGQDPDLHANIREQLKRTPWWLISILVHGLVLFVLGTIIWSTAEPPKKNIYKIKIPQRKPPPPEKQQKRDLFETNKEINPELKPLENPVVMKDVPEEETETFNEEEMIQKAKGIQEAISQMPFDDIGVLDTMGLGGGAGGTFGWRNGGGRRNAVASGGGSRASESAVEKALEWLAKHQDDNGAWDCDGYTKHCGGDVCGGEGNEHGDAAMTGISLLAFLGAGYTHKIGKWKDTVDRGLKKIMQWQDENGAIASNGVPITNVSGAYNFPMASLALVEAYGMTQDARLHEPAQQVVNAIVDFQKSDGGWRYGSGGSDTSVTGWYVMALKSAKVAGLKVPNAAFLSAKQYLDSASAGKGQHGGLCVYNPQKGKQPSTTMTAVGMLCRQFMGAQPKEPSLIEGGEYLMNHPQSIRWPEQLTYEVLLNRAKQAGKLDKSSAGGLPHLYYWYYGTLTMFQMGGRYWDFWNSHIRDILVNRQRTDGHRDGSWDPIGRSTFTGSVAGKHKKGGRIFSTALCALSLEVYYRYLPMYR